MKTATLLTRQDPSSAHARRSGTAFALHRSALYLLIAASAINLILT